MNNFQIEFKRLKADRGLSNKQIASFTGVKVKDVKQWEAGTSFPTDIKIINALEGLLGTEITRTLDGFSTEQLKEVGSLLTEESLFSIKNDDVQIKQTRIDRLRNTFQRKETTLNDFDYESIEVLEVKEDTQEEYLTNPVQTTNLLEFSEEEPYIYDQKQIGFYFTRNLKTAALLLVFGIVIFNLFYLFWDSLRIFLNNLL